MSTFFNAEFIIRLFMAIALGFALGLERELTNKYAGLRTHILVCLGACIFTLLSIYAFPTFATGDNVDVAQATGIRDTSRVAAQIVTGIGFIGAGTVLRNGPMVFGLTTAATLWIAASIGMACGAGIFDVAIIATVLSVAVLTLIRIFEKQILPSSGKLVRRCKMTVYLNINDVKTVYDFLCSNVENVRDFSSKKLLENPQKAKVTVVFDIGCKRALNSFYNKVNGLVNLDSISLQELND